MPNQNFGQKVIAALYRWYYNFLSVFDVCPWDQELQNYWVRRRQLFTKLNQGIEFDAESLFSTTPEKIALHIASKAEGKTIIDAFCGVGGNSIAFARYCPRVFAYDINANRLAMARRNAEVYGVAHKISFFKQDFLRPVTLYEAEVIFLDPPWGGPKYNTRTSFHLGDFAVNITQVLKYALQNFPLVIFKVPRQFDPMHELASFGRKFTVEENWLHGELNCKTIYFS